jgi:hypothetical protein
MLYHVLDRMPMAIMNVYGKDTQDTMDDQIDAMRLGFCTAATLIRRKAVPAQICVGLQSSTGLSISNYLFGGECGTCSLAAE